MVSSVDGLAGAATVSSSGAHPKSATDELVAKLIDMKPEREATSPQRVNRPNRVIDECQF
jgi:hypothetical protein